MLESHNREFLIEGHRRFEKTGDRKHIDDAIKTVKAIAPEHFFQGDDDWRLSKRVFFHEPFSSHWSGTYIKKYQPVQITKK